MHPYHLTHIAEDYFISGLQPNSDLSYVLRQVLLRGIREAEYRSFRSEPVPAEVYKQIMLELETYLFEIESSTFTELAATPETRARMMGHVRVCEWLVSQDIVEGRIAFDNIISAVTDHTDMEEADQLAAFH